MARTTILVPGALAVDGLADVTRGLRRVNLQGAVTKAHKTVADPVRDKAVAKWAQQRIKPQIGDKVIRTTATQQAAGIVLKYSTHPYAAGVEFGSYKYRQFRRWRGNRFVVTAGASTGYVVQDTIAENLDRITNDYADAATKAIDNAMKG